MKPAAQVSRTTGANARARRLAATIWDRAPELVPGRIGLDRLDRSQQKPAIQLPVEAKISRFT
jgi:hypothetical protein